MRYTRIIISLLLAMASLGAAPMSSNFLTAPVPLGGIETLEKLVEYPRFARENHIDGKVILQVDIDSHGVVREVEVIQSGGKMLDAAAVSAVHGIRWEPARHGEQAIASRYLLPFEFRSR